MVPVDPADKVEMEVFHPLHGNAILMPGMVAMVAGEVMEVAAVADAGEMPMGFALIM